MARKNLELDYDDARLLQEAMQRFTRSVGGDLSREKNPSQETKDKMSDALNLGDRIDHIVEGEWH